MRFSLNFERGLSGKDHFFKKKFFPTLEKKLKTCIGKKSQRTKISENGKTWVGMTILLGFPRNSLVAHNLEYEFVIVIK